MVTRLAAFALVWPSMIASAQVTVVAGTYGENCGAPRGNKTSHLAELCNGKRKYRVDHKIIGDPVIGCGKNYLAEWRCAAVATVGRGHDPEAVLPRGWKRERGRRGRVQREGGLPLRGGLATHRRPRLGLRQGLRRHLALQRLEEDGERHGAR
jgi:hypothetical protein